MILQFKRPCILSAIRVEFQADVLEDGSVWYRMIDIKTGKWMGWERV
jgi:hypothetical protein